MARYQVEFRRELIEYGRGTIEAESQEEADRIARERRPELMDSLDWDIVDPDQQDESEYVLEGVWTE